MTQIQQQPGTALPWKFERMESAKEFAALKGETLEEHEGYFRDNDGAWIITGGNSDDDEDSYGRLAAVSFKGKAKRGDRWNAPDPIGQANARYIVTAANAYPKLLAQRDELVAALEEARVVVEAVVDLARNSSGKIAYAGRATSAAANLLTRIDSALANARQGEEG